MHPANDCTARTHHLCSRTGLHPRTAGHDLWADDAFYHFVTKSLGPHRAAMYTADADCMTVELPTKFECS